MYKLLGILMYYLKYRRFQWFSDERIFEYQIKKINKLLRSKGIRIKYSNPREGLKAFTETVPILSKAEVRENPSKFLLRKPSFFDLEFHTSGSTGKPMKAWVSWRHWIVEQAVIYRHWKWHGYRFRDRCGMIRSYSPKAGEPLIKHSWALNTYYYSPFHLDDNNMEDYYRHMVENNVRYLRGYPSSIKIFAEFCKKKGYQIPRLKFILTASEVLSLKDRKFIEETFSVKVGDHYGLAEQIVMFGNCSQSNMLHNYNEYGYCELIPTDKEYIYRIIGTNLHNDLMPLLRYDTGDLAYVRPGAKCPCGRQGIQVESIIGRSDQNLVDSVGHTIPTVNFYTLMEFHTELQGWQIVQNGDSIVLLCQVDDEKELLLEQLESEIMRGLSARLANTVFHYRVSFTNSLVKIREGKTPVIVKNVEI